MQTSFGTHTVLQPQVTFMQHRHVAEAVKIERLSFDEPWSKKDFMRLVRAHESGQGGMPAAFAIEIPTPAGMKTVGHIIGEGDGPFFDLLNLAIHPDWRRKRIMFAVIRWLQGECNATFRPMMRTMVCDDNELAHKFFWACNFRAVGVVRKMDGENDWYEFRWDMREDDVLNTPRLRNIFQTGEDL